MKNSLRKELKKSLDFVTNEDLQVIRKLKSLGTEYAMIGILSRLGFLYDEKTGYSFKGSVIIKYDKINSDYKVITQSEEDHIPVDGLILFARKKYLENLEESSKGKSNYLQAIREKAKATS